MLLSPRIRQLAAWVAGWVLAHYGGVVLFMGSCLVRHTIYTVFVFVAIGKLSYSYLMI
jgi:hypothetical protein